MPIYNEVWEEEGKFYTFYIFLLLYLIIFIDFMYRSYINLKTLPKNNLHKLSLLKFDFIEYKVIYKCYNL